MEYLLGSFAVFFVIHVVSGYVTMPKWAWIVAQVVLSIGIWVWIGPEGPWRVLMICGVVTIIRRLEALLLVTTDRATVELLRSRR